MLELLDAQGRAYRPVAANLSPVQLTEPEAEHLALLGVAPSATFPAQLPWMPLALNGRPQTESPWLGGTVQFAADEERGPATKLIWYGDRRQRAELPFEFRDVPIP
jgi:hypothetical protein